MKSYYDQLKRELDGIELEEVCLAQAWVYETLCDKKNCKIDIALKELLVGSFLKKNNSNSAFVRDESKMKTSVSAFRSEYRHQDKIKNIDKFKSRIAFYWTMLSLKFTDIKFEVNATANRKIKITTDDKEVYYPETKAEINEEYLGFYPRSREDVDNKFGILTLTLLNSKSVKANVNEGEFQVTAYYQTLNTTLAGKYREEGRIIYMRTDRKSSGNHLVYPKKIMEEQDREKVIHTQYIFHRSEHDKKYIMGIMVTANRQKDFGFASNFIAMKKSDYEIEYLDGKTFTQSHAIDLVKGKDLSIPPIIEYHLWGKRLTTNYENYHIDKDIDLPFSNQMDVLSKIQGKYLVYRLHQNENKDLRLHYESLTIKPNGYVIIDEKDDSKNGYISYIETEKTRGYYYINIHLGVSESKKYIQQIMNLEMESKSDPFLKGVYMIAGGEEPRAGKIVLEKFLNETEIPDPIYFNYKEMKEILRPRILHFFYEDKEKLPGTTLDIPINPINLPTYLPHKLSLFCTIPKSSNYEYDFENYNLIKMNLNLSSRTFRLTKNMNGDTSGTIELYDSKLILKTTDSAQNEIIYISIPSPADNIDFSYATGSMIYYFNDWRSICRQVIITRQLNPKKEFEIFSKQDLMEMIKNESMDENLKFAYNYLFAHDSPTFIRSMNKINDEIKKSTTSERHAYPLQAIAILLGINTGAPINYNNSGELGKVKKLFQKAKQNHFLDEKFLDNIEYEKDKKIMHNLKKLLADKKIYEEVIEILK